jgi:hypothetical protein
VFWTSFIGSLIQGWVAFSLLIMSFMQYLTYNWLKILEILVTPYSIGSYQMESNTLGNLNKIANNFIYCALVDQLLIIVMGIESFFHPQLVNVHFILYLIPIGLISVSSGIFSTASLLSEARIIFLKQNQEVVSIWLTSFQKKKINHYSLVLTVIVSILWIGFSILAHFKVFAFTIPIPGSTERLYVSYMVIFIAIFSIAHPIVLFYIVHKSIVENSITYMQNNEILGSTKYLRMIRHYILIPRLYRA